MIELSETDSLIVRNDEAIGNPLVQCKNCNEHYEKEEIVTNSNGISFCSVYCRDEFPSIEEDHDDTCHVCRGTGEGQNDYCSCYACKGKGYIVKKEEQEP